MARLIVTSPKRNSGKTVFSLGASLAYRDRAGYVKPISEKMLPDGSEADYKLFSKILSEENSREPFLTVEKLNRDELIEGTKRAIESLEESGRELVLVEFAQDSFLGFSRRASAIDLFEELEGKMIVVSECDQRSLDRLVLMLDSVPESSRSRMMLVLNKVREESLPLLDEFEGIGIDVIGEIPYDFTLGAVRLRDIAASLDADVLCCEEMLDRRVENILIGAMTAESAIRYFRSKERSLVITGGDREDIQLAALSVPVEALILTGGMRPPDYLIERAARKQVPLLVVEYDTMTTAQRILDTVFPIDPEDRERVEVVRRLVSKNVDLGALLE